MTLRILGIVALAASAAVAPHAQQPPVFRSGVEAVQLDVYVTDEQDRPVTGLTKEDFEVFENDAQQAITTFAEVNSPLERRERLPFDAESDVQSNTRPHRHVYLIILNNEHLRARHLVRQFLDNHFSDDDVAAIVVGRGLATSGQDFTSNRRLLHEALDRGGGGGSDAHDLWQRMELMARIPGGRKSVLWFSPSALDTYGIIDYNGGVLGLQAEYQHAAVSAATRANVRVYPIDPEGLTPDGFDIEGHMNLRALAELTGGLAQIGSNTFTETFERLERETSSYYVLGFDSTITRKQGRHIALEVKVKRPGLTVRSRTGYVEQLAYVRARMPPEPTRTPAETALASPLATTGIPMRVAAAPFKKSGRNATIALAIDLDAARLEFTERDGRFATDIEIRHLATDARAKIHPEFRHRAALALDTAAHQRVTSSGIRVVTQFDLPDGRYQIRVASANGEANASVIYDLEVPDFRDNPLAMSGVAITSVHANSAFTLRPDKHRSSDRKAKTCRERVCEPGVSLDGTLTRWEATASPGDAQMLQEVLPAPPTTSREFAPDDTLALFAEVYDNNERVRKDPPYTIQLIATLHNAEGFAVRRISDKRDSRSSRRPSGGHGFTLRMPLADLGAGPYVLRLEAASDRDHRHTVARNIPIQVR
jgi:VWFA-related protein